ncbi:MAG TPA: tRNA (adenosine(37)-N6)-dimethylallyltransferase MiaA [Flavobacterium sp.]
MQPRKLITVVGPTAIGKTSLAIELAQHFSCEIISCDSRQFYREMQIGTAVPSDDELAAAPHHFIQHISIFDHYTVGNFEKDALSRLDSLFADNNHAIMVGGSGLYVDAVLKGLDVFPEVDQQVRANLQQGYELHGLSFLQQKLLKLDPRYFDVVDTENPQRIMRALEVCISSGTPYSSFLGKKQLQRGFKPVLIGLEADRNVMYERINSRVDQMMEQGLLDEARKLYPNRNLNALKTVGYSELFRYFDGEISLDFAVSEIKKNTRRFAKRQMTWFRKNTAIKWFDFTTSPGEIFKSIKF